MRLDRTLRVAQDGVLPGKRASKVPKMRAGKIPGPSRCGSGMWRYLPHLGNVLLKCRLGLTDIIHREPRGCRHAVPSRSGGSSDSRRNRIGPGAEDLPGNGVQSLAATGVGCFADAGRAVYLVRSTPDAPRSDDHSSSWIASFKATRVRW